MAIRRGTLYSLTAVPGVSGYLVLSNDQWNTARTEEAAGALVYESPGAARVALAGGKAFVGELVAVSKAALGNPLTQLSAADLRPVEELVCDSLALRELHQQPPQPPPAQPGAIDYPLWSQIYYAGPPLGDPPQNKRRVVASVDSYNSAMRGAVCIRTTTRGKPGPGFPQLTDGTIAVAMAPTLFFNPYVRFQPRQERPSPSQLFLADMALVAAGIVDALELHHLV
ncbi:MAG: hypothetical protein AAB295_02030 [Chloroflexota bacterium]